MKSICFLVSLAAVLSLPSIGQEAASVGDLERALGLKLGEVAELKPESGERLQRIAEVCGLPELPRARVFTATTNHPRSRKAIEADVCRIAVQGVSGIEALAVASFEGGLVSVGVEGKADAVAGWSAFLSQFRGRPELRLEDARPVAALRARRADAALGDDSDDRDLRVLLRLRGAMLGAASHVMPIFSSKERKAVPEPVIAELTRTFTEVRDLSSDFPLIGSDAKSFRAAADAALDYVARLPRNVEEDTEERRAALKSAAMRSCMACHMMKRDSFEGTLMSAAAARREELGAGNGFFVLLHDVIPRKGRTLESQRLATLVRAAALLASRP